jgi:hypothetical protein
MSLTFHSALCKHSTEPSIDANKFRFIWLLSFRGKDFFRNRPIGNKNCLWWPCLLMDQNKMINLYKGPSIHASYQVSVHLAKRL